MPARARKQVETREKEVALLGGKFCLHQRADGFPGFELQL